MSVTTTFTGSGEQSRFVRTTGLLCIVGGVVVAVGAAISGLLPGAVSPSNLSYPFTPAVFRITQPLWAVSHLLIFLGLLGLGRSGAIGPSRVGTIGLWIALIGMALVPICEPGFAFFAAETVDSTPGMLLNAVIGVGSTLAGLGFVLVGIAVIRFGAWQGWYRFTPLLCGLFVFIVLTPVLATAPALFFWAISGWSVCFVLLGIALLRQFSPPERASLSTARA